MPVSPTARWTCDVLDILAAWLVEKPWTGESAAGAGEALGGSESSQQSQSCVSTDSALLHSSHTWTMYSVLDPRQPWSSREPPLWLACSKLCPMQHPKVFFSDLKRVASPRELWHWQLSWGRNLKILLATGSKSRSIFLAPHSNLQPSQGPSIHKQCCRAEFANTGVTTSDGRCDRGAQNHYC